VTTNRVPTTARSTKRISILCKSDPIFLQSLFPNAKTGEVTITISTCMLFNRTMRSMRLSTATVSGHLVMVQYESDPELTYLTREQFGAPSMPADIRVTEDNVISAGWNPSNAGRADKKPAHVFFTATCPVDTDATSHSGQVNNGVKQTILHHYTMTTPGNGKAVGLQSEAGTWGTPMNDEMLTLAENLQNVSNGTSLTVTPGSLKFVTSTRNEYATGYLCVNNLAKLQLSPVSANMFTADVQFKLEQLEKKDDF